MPKLSELVPLHGERGIALGTTGSGKTVCIKNLSRHLMLGMENGEMVIIHDAKDTFVSPFPAQRVEGLSKFAKLIQTNKLQPIVRYVPTPAEMNDVSFQVPLWDWIYERGKIKLKTRIIIDEVFSTVTDTGRASASMRALWTRGRELGITALACSQRPKTIPGWMVDQAERFFVYEVPTLADRERITEVTTAAPPLDWQQLAEQFGADADGRPQVTNKPAMMQTPPGEYNCWYWYRKERKTAPRLIRFPLI